MCVTTECVGLQVCKMTLLYHRYYRHLIVSMIVHILSGRIPNWKSYAFRIYMQYKYCVQLSLHSKAHSFAQETPIEKTKVPF